MNVYDEDSAGKRRNHNDAENSIFAPTLPSLYSESDKVPVESEISPYFRFKAETLTDDESDDENKSNSSSSVNSDSEIKPKPPELKKCWDTFDEALKNESLDNNHGSSCNEKKSSKKSKKRKSTSKDQNGSEKKKKKIKKEKNVESVAPGISSTAQRMMQNMGYEKGKGLGKYGQGRVAPISVSERKGRRGLGLVIADVDRSLIKYDPSKEVTTVNEEINWLDGACGIKLDVQDLLIWIGAGPKKRILDDETYFCDADILKNVLICKSAFDKMSGDDMRRARSRSNPYELIKKGPFLNRAAMKMANMDCNFDYMFTNPTDEFQNSLVGENELLYFADVCAGPGGFSEYVLFKKKWGAKGFGFTLKGDNDFKLTDFYAGPCESFEPFYGECEDGDIYKSRNILSFSRYVCEQTDKGGVHFMMADGGFSVEGSENIQEILSKRIYLCQFLVALSIVRIHGHFVCKLFDIFTPFSVGLVFLMYHCFKRISLHKPNTSRPANSERYIICKWKNENVDNVRDYLFHVNEEFDHFGSTSDTEVNEVVPLDIIKSDQKFMDYIIQSNNTLGERQVNSLAKILEYSEDDNLIEEKQQVLKKECMDTWKIPLGARKGPSNDHPDVLCRNLLHNDIAFLRQSQKNIIDFTMGETLYTVHDWHAVILGGAPKSATFYLSVAHKKCFKYDRSGARWIPAIDLNLELSPETLLFGEIVPELTNQSRSQRKVNVFHIIDGHTLGGKDISHLHYTERIVQCRLYAKSLTRPNMYNIMQLRMKDVYELEDLEQQSFCEMELIEMKTTRKRLAVPLKDADPCNQYYVPRGIMFIKATKVPYRRFISRSNKLKYYWAPEKSSVFDKDRTQECVNNFSNSYQESYLWFPDEEEEKSFNMQNFVKELVFYIRENMYTRKDEKKTR